MACNRAGNAGLATSGSGDTLAGIVVGLAARGASPFAAACWAVSLHARAGDRLARKMGPLGFLPRELLAEIPRLMADLSQRPS
jgi:NAD(P)H-hydrate repair Nnr-like enzyme with NAD(P)H-hydrate dehydratase domain